MIKVLHTYSGRLTNKQKIFPNIYAENDPALFGIADYLVENGHALRLDIPFATNDSKPQLDRDPALALNRELLGQRVVVSDGNLVANIPSPTDNVETPIVSEPLAVDVSEDTEELEAPEIEEKPAKNRKK